MSGFKIKYNFDSDWVYIRDIEFINTDDHRYIELYEHYRDMSFKRKENKGDVEKIFNDLAGHRLARKLEYIIQHWTNSSKKRILYWEEGGNSGSHNKCAENDFIIEKDENNIIIGEIKTQMLSYRKHKNKMASQFNRKKSVLDCIPGLNYEFVGITVIVEKTDDVLEFKDNFFDMEMIKIETERLTMFKMRISAKDVIDYGIRNNIIENDKMLIDAYEEIECNKK